MDENTPLNIVEQPQPAPESKGKKALSFVWEIVKIAVVALVIVLPIRYFLFQPFIVKGESMSPNFESGDYLIVDEISYRFATPQRGDVVVFKTDFIPGYYGQRFIKRVIGLPGETVEVHAGKVEVISNGKDVVLDESYLPKNLQTAGEVNTMLKANEYFVMGDNRANSYDSRSWGVVPKEDIIGKAFIRVLPIAALSQIPHQSY